MNDKELSRIYQGRVTGVAVDDKVLPLAEGEELLWKHHCLFQDAVNYYILALAAMATDKKSTVGRMRESLGKVWKPFRKNGAEREGMEASLRRIFPTEGELSMERAMELILDGNDASPDMLQAAVSIIAEKCKGDVQQPGDTCFSQLCSPDFTKKGNFDFDANAKQACLGGHRLIDALECQEPVAAIQKLSEDMQINWCGIKTQPGMLFTPLEVQVKIGESIAYYKDASHYNNIQIQGDLGQFLQSINMSYKSIQCLNLQRNATGPKNDAMFYAFFLAKFFPSPESVSLLKSFLPGIKKKCRDLNDFKYDDDPVKLSRCSRGYAFKAFTVLMFDNAWKEFDKLAFTEALKTLNQFNQKTEEREEKLAKYRAAIEWMDGKSQLKKAPPAPDCDVEEDDEEDAVSLPVLAGDARWEKLLNILNDALKIRNGFTEDEFREYGLSQRTIRESGYLFKKWNETLQKGRKEKLSDNDISRQLLEMLNQYQTEHSETIGSVNLFRELIKPDCFCIWDNAWQEETGKDRSADILHDAVRYFEWRDEIDILSEPIQISPADAKYSRRLSDFKVLSPTSQDKKLGKLIYKVGYGFLGDDKAAFDIAMQINGDWTRKKVTVQFSAPRLKRDGLLYNAAPVYCPPVAQAWLDKESADRVDIQSTPIQLMPDFDKKGCRRILLNFPVKLDISAIQGCTKSRFDEKQFSYFSKDEKCALQWPAFAKKPLNWNIDGTPFDIVSVDLGQRTAGACTRIHVSTESSEHSIFLGNDGKHSWYADRRYAGLLRLPGEDCKVFRDGKMQEELSGSEGRLATQEETDEACRLWEKLLPGEEENLLQTGIRNDGSPIFEKYFPRQNDILLRTFSKALGRLRSLARWHGAMNDVTRVQNNIDEEIKDCPWLVDKTPDGIKAAELSQRKTMKEVLLALMERILPLRGRGWKYQPGEGYEGFILHQAEMGTADAHRWICGQRGLSFARLEQLETLRKYCQSLNRLLMAEPGDKVKTPREMRDNPVPDCCPDILRRLDDMKEQRVNQTANLILSQALGVRHVPHKTAASERNLAGIHGEYEKIEECPPVAFIVIENLSRYRFSQDRSRFENSRLMKWSHRAIAGKLKMLCEVFGIPVVEVNAAYSSKFTADSIPGFRAEEGTLEKLMRDRFLQNRAKDDSVIGGLIDDLKSCASEMLKLDSQARMLLPKEGGPLFIPFAPSEWQKQDFVQADINAAFNLGIRALAIIDNFAVQNRLVVEKKREAWALRRTSGLGKYLSKDEDISWSLFQEDEKFKQSGGNVFLLGCSTSDIGRQSLISENARLAGYTGKMMFGSSIWRDIKRKLEICLRLNQRKLEKMRAKHR